MAPILPSLLLIATIPVEHWSTAELEKAYWDCEFAAVQGRLELSDAAGCSELYEQLKSDKFHGDFARFLAWWRENKDRELSSRMYEEQRRRDR
ncbi:MAG TPA: hypothetical protein VGE12_18015 [Noviherbaspirillum sp.]